MMRPIFDRITFLLPSVLLLLMLALATPVDAQQPPPGSPPTKSPLGGVPQGAAERGLTAGRPAAAITSQSAPQAAAPAGVLGRSWAWIESQRAYFNRQMSLAVRSLKTEPLGAALISLMMICFTYGVLHAAGPGHGKGVISAYALANNETVRRGILLSFMSALIQALSAIAIFVVLTLAFSARKTDFDRVENWLETASWALVAGIGAWLLIRRLRTVFTSTPAHPHVDQHKHAHEQHQAAPHRHPHAHHDHAATHDHQHAHAQGHEHDAHCGHVHIPLPEQLGGAWSWRRAFGIAASVGIRPCTGALILLAFCSANGLLWAGILGTLAMSLGTAIAISTLAALAIGSRNAATWFGSGDTGWGRHVGTAAGIVGSALVFVMGAAFFVMSLNGTGPL